jgi:archaellum component FlaC
MNEFLSFLSSLDTWVQVWCAALVVFFAIFLVAMLFQSRSVRKSIDSATTLFRGAAPGSRDERRFGRSLTDYERIQGLGQKLGPPHKGWWRILDDAVEKYDSPDGRQGYFITRPVAEVLTSNELTLGYPWRLYHAVPGILTSLGLLGTFVAILIGLVDLKMDPSGTVTGLDNLIANLSGKFLTSIIALFLSVVFLMVELAICQPRLRAARARLSAVLSDVLPYLSPSRLLLDLQRQSVKQSTALGHISADIVDKFAEVFKADLAPVFAHGISNSMASQLQTEMGPTLTELSSTMRELATTVARLESTKQESVVGELRGLTDSLERSLKETLSDMGRQFQTALTGSTKDEFGQLAGIISTSASVVEQMNSNFVLLQGTLQQVVAEARSTTSAQMAAGAEQTQRLNSLVEGLMVRLNDTANQNYEQLTGTLTHVVTELSDRVTRLSEELVTSVSTAAERSQSAAAGTMQQAGEWSAQTSKQLADILANMDTKSAQFDRAGQTLLAAQATLQATLDRNNTALEALGKAAGEVRAYTTGLAGIQRQIDDGQKSQVQLATISQQSVAKLAEAAARHDQFLQQYEATFQRYRYAFEGLDAQVGQILETILDRLQQYNRSVEANFRLIVESANNVMPRMAQVLKSSTDELKEHLDELNDVLEKGATRIANSRGA